MKTMNTADRPRKRTWNLRVSAWVMSCISCIFLSQAVHGQGTCMDATVRLQSYAQQVQVAANSHHVYLQSQYPSQLQGQIQQQCLGCGYDTYCQQVCQAQVHTQVTQYFGQLFGQLNQWYTYQMQQIGNWYNMINMECALGRARAMPEPEVVVSGRNDDYGENRRLVRRLEDLEEEVARAKRNEETEIATPGEIEVEIVIPDAPVGMSPSRN